MSKICGGVAVAAALWMACEAFFQRKCHQCLDQKISNRKITVFARDGIGAVVDNDKISQWLFYQFKNIHLFH